MERTPYDHVSSAYTAGAYTNKNVERLGLCTLVKI